MPWVSFGELLAACRDGYICRVRASAMCPAEINEFVIMGCMQCLEVGVSVVLSSQSCVRWYPDYVVEKLVRTAAMSPHRK